MLRKAEAVSSPTVREDVTTMLGDELSGGRATGAAICVMSWSGGKDSALALREVLRGGEFKVAALVTTLMRGHERVQIQNIRRELIERQAASLGLPLHCIYIEKGASNVEYEAALAEAFAPYRDAGVETVAFGDLFLEDLRAYREEFLARCGMRGLFPLWRRDTGELMDDFVAANFKAVVTSVNASALDRSFAGRLIDHDFVTRLPAGVDPCGENGEFHTFVFDAPAFSHPITFIKGQVTTEDGFHFCDLLPD